MNDKEMKALRRMIEAKVPDDVKTEEYHNYVDERIKHITFLLQYYRKENPPHYLRLIRDIKKHEDE